MAELPEFIAALRATLPQPVALCETHISWVLLAGDLAYKIKKPVNFGFLDFSTLGKRDFYCHEELRLNRRLAPQLYLDVLPITGSEASPQLGGDGPILDYAVKMRRFAGGQQLDAMLAEGRLETRHIDAVAQRIAAFHAALPAAPVDSSWGSAEAVHQPAAQNFTQIRARLCEAADLDRLQILETWSESEFRQLGETFEQRHRDGFIRECHGDLHLANLAWFGDEIVPFDCIDFNENLRWIDVISEIAFLAMDLHDRQRPDLAWRLLNIYLEQSGDYAGLAVLRYYLVYRALVRAKVAALRGPDGLAGCRDYLNLACSFVTPPAPFLILTHGLSGSGKTILAGQMAEALGAIRIRSDVERKRLHGLAPQDRSNSPLDGGLYGPDGHLRTYRRLAELAGTLLAADYPVIVDAAFLKREERDNFAALAEERGAPCCIVDLQAPPEFLRERVASREQVGNDASEATVAVLEKQLGFDESLAENEKCRAILMDARHLDVAEVLRRVRQQACLESAFPPAPSSASGHR
ncbi:MAG: AAA family ATPase [Sulfuricella sp.]|nr:AAA family ATPase [Sulfuricella sp.]